MSKKKTLRLLIGGDLLLLPESVRACDTCALLPTVRGKVSVTVSEFG